MTQTIERTQSLEELVMQTSFRERDNALAEIQGGIQPILYPRSTVGFRGIAHFLPVPASPQVQITRGGMPSEASQKEQQRFQQELQAISQRERELTNAAQVTQSKIPTLLQWGQRLGETEDILLLSVLDEEDRSDIESYVRAHRRFVRTCQHMADALRF